MKSRTDTFMRIEKRLLKKLNLKKVSQSETYNDVLKRLLKGRWK